MIYSSNTAILILSDGYKGNIMIGGKTNQQILELLNKKIYGHKAAKVALINLVNRSKLRYYQKYICGKEPSVPTSNCLLIGESGTGKTYMVQCLAEVCEFPLVIIDANQLAPSSANGITPHRFKKIIEQSVRSCLEQQPDTYYSYEGTLSQVVVFIDEIDKLAKPFDSSSNWNAHVQATFLTIIEDLYNDSEYSHVSFIFAGAFNGLKKIKTKSNGIGFSKLEEDKVDEVDLEEEIVKYGLMTELVGRIKNIAELDKFNEEEMGHILDNIIMPLKLKELEAFNLTEWRLPSNDRLEIIKKAAKSSMGVRTIHKELNKLTNELEFDFEWKLNEEDYKMLETDYITAETIDKLLMEFGDDE